MAGNGLNFELLQFQEPTQQDILNLVESLQINVLTQAQVHAKYLAWIAEYYPDNTDAAHNDLLLIAAMLFVNGAHESLPGTLVVNEENTWAVLKERTGFKASMKSMFMRWCTPIMHMMVMTYGTTDRNLLCRLATKWQIQADFDALPLAAKYFGAYYDVTLSGEDRAKSLKFQKKIIALATGEPTVRR